MAVLAIIAIAFNVLDKEDPMNVEGHGLKWEPYDPSVLKRLLKAEVPETGDCKRMDLSLALSVPTGDERIRESMLLIQSLDDKCGKLIYQGPFQERISLNSVPYSKKWVTLVFWAFHEKTRTSVSWHSRNTWPVFIDKLLFVDLYDSYHEEEDGWYSIREASFAQ